MYDLYAKVHVAVHTNGDVTLVGPLEHNVDFGGGPLVGEGPGTYIVRLDARGSHVRSSRVRLSLIDVAIGHRGDAVVSGPVPGDEPYAFKREVVRVDAVGHE